MLLLIGDPDDHALIARLGDESVTIHTFHDRDLAEAAVNSGPALRQKVEEDPGVTLDSAQMASMVSHLAERAGHGLRLTISTKLELSAGVAGGERYVVRAQLDDKAPFIIAAFIWEAGCENEDDVRERAWCEAAAAAATAQALVIALNNPKVAPKPLEHFIR
jgi:hypothetical protein